MILAEIMFSKNYYLLSLTYLFEAIRLYASYSFKKKNIINNYTWNNVDIYKLNSEVMSCIGQKEFGDRYRDTRYDRDGFYTKNSDVFESISIEYQKLRELRNNLTHINHKESQPNIKSDLKNLLESIGALIKDDILKDLKR